MAFAARTPTMLTPHRAKRTVRWEAPRTACGSKDAPSARLYGNLIVLHVGVRRVIRRLATNRAKKSERRADHEVLCGRPVMHRKP
jgi:hypothetical protein